MDLNIQAWQRKSFPIDAVRVTEENMAQVAEWSGGSICTDETSKLPYIAVDVFKPAYARQSMAFVGDWVTKSDSKFRVFTVSAFERAFEPANPCVDNVTPFDVSVDKYPSQHETAMMKSRKARINPRQSGKRQKMSKPGIGSVGKELIDSAKKQGITISSITAKPKPPRPMKATNGVLPRPGVAEITD